MKASEAKALVDNVIQNNLESVFKKIKESALGGQVKTFFPCGFGLDNSVLTKGITDVLIDHDYDVTNDDTGTIKVSWENA